MLLMFRDDIGIVNLILISLLLLLEAEDVDNVVLVLDDEIHKVTVVILFIKLVEFGSGNVDFTR